MNVKTPPPAAHHLGLLGGHKGRPAQCLGIHLRSQETRESFRPRRQAPTVPSDWPGKPGCEQDSVGPRLCGRRLRMGWAWAHLHGQPQLLDPVFPFLRPWARFSVIPPQEIAPYQKAGLALLWPVPHHLWGSPGEVGGGGASRSRAGSAGAGPAGGRGRQEGGHSPCRCRRTGCPRRGRTCCACDLSRCAPPAPVSPTASPWPRPPCGR